MDIITSRTNPAVARFLSLREKKVRDESGLFSFEGRKLYGEAKKSGALVLDQVYMTQSAAEKYGDGSERIVSEPVAEKMTELGTNDGIFCVARKQSGLHYSACGDLSGGRALFLSQVRDPGNIGTIIRTAAAFGLDMLILSADCADIYNSKTVRASMGTLFRQQILIAENDVEMIGTLRKNGFDVYAAALDSSSEKLGEIAFGRKLAFVLGNEGHGLCENVISACSGSVIIPMKCGVESLNVSAAATVLIWEMMK